MRGQVEPRVVTFSAEVETRLAPVLDKLGLKPRSQRPLRKARKTAKAAKKPAPVRRAVRKPAKRAARKA